MAVARGDQEAAKNYSKQAVELALSTEDMPLASGIVEAVADVDLLAGDDELAARTSAWPRRCGGCGPMPDRDVRRVGGTVARGTR